jgi:hypothetical protein
MSAPTETPEDATHPAMELPRPELSSEDFSTENEKGSVFKCPSLPFSSLHCGWVSLGPPADNLGDQCLSLTQQLRLTHNHVRRY